MATDNDKSQKKGRGRPKKSEVSGETNSSNFEDQFNTENTSTELNENSNVVDLKLIEGEGSGIYVEDNEVVHESEGLIKATKTVSDEDQYQMPNEDANFEQDAAIESSSQDLADINDDIPDTEFDPLQIAVKERGYTSGKIESGNDDVSPEIKAENEKKIEEKIPEPEIKNPTYEDLQPKKEEKKKNTGGGGKGSDGGGNNNGGGKSEEEFDGFETPREEKKETANSKLDDLTPAQKRKAAEKAADAILLTYQKFVPKPFKALSSFNMRKLQIMEMKDEITLDAECFDDGTTIKKYCQDVNKQVEQTFVITDEMKEEAKDPLVDLLLENNLALTPAQRLLMVVGGHVVQMGVTAIQFMNQNKHALNEFKRFHNESLAVKKAAMNEAEKRFESNNTNNNNNNNSGTVNQTPNNTPPPPPKTTPKPQPEPTVQYTDDNDDIPESNDEDVPNFTEETTSDNDNDNNEETTQETQYKQDATIVDEKIDVKEKDPSLDEYLTEENGGITVEVEENRPEDGIEEF